MGLISTIKSMLGIEGSRDRAETGTTVRVERERAGTRPETPTPTQRTVEEDPSDSSGSGIAAESPISEETGAPSGDPVDTIKGIGPAYAERLSEAGIETVDELAEADADALAERVDISASRLGEWIDRAKGR